MPKMRVLANDGMAADGIKLLEEAGFEVITETIPQAELPERVGEFDVLVVRSATKVNKQVLENPGKLKLVVRAGVGIDNIDVEAAEAKGVMVNNTPNSSSLSVAELVFAHLFTLARFLHESNRNMPGNGASDFKNLKKKYEKGIELRGKTLGLIGFGRIAQETAKIAIGIGMKLIVYNRTPKTETLVFDHLPFTPAPTLDITTTTLDEVVEQADFISLHVPHEQGRPPILTAEHFSKMKKGVGIINCARGGVIDEDELMQALSEGKVNYAALDVFVNEPTPREDLLKLPNVSYTPHIGASTAEAQKRVARETAELIISKLKK